MTKEVQQLPENSFISVISKVKAHIVFDEDQTAYSEERKIILDRLKKAAKTADTNQDHFERYENLDLQC